MILYVILADILTEIYKQNFRVPTPIQVELNEY